MTLTSLTYTYQLTFIYYHKIKNNLKAYHIILIASCQDQGVGTVIAPAVNTGYMWPVDSRFTDLERPNNLKKVIAGLNIYWLCTEYATFSLTAAIQLSSCVTDLHSEFPQGADGDTGDWAIVVGRNDGALLGSTNTGHSLEREE